MHETGGDLLALQEVLDRSYAAAGAHLLSIHTPERRLRAEQLVEQLEGFRHIRARPQVSATYLPGEQLAVTVHGRAIPIDVQAETGAGIRQTLLDIYVPRYGPAWEEFLDSATVYARIEADVQVFDA